MDSRKRPSILLRLKEAASIIGVSEQTLRRWDQKGKIEVVRIGGQRRVPLREALKLAKEHFKGGDIYMTFHVRDYATSELLRAIAEGVDGVTFLDERDVTSIIVSALAHIDEGPQQCNTTEPTTKP